MHLLKAAMIMTFSNLQCVSVHVETMFCPLKRCSIAGVIHGGARNMVLEQCKIVAGLLCKVLVVQSFERLCSNAHIMHCNIEYGAYLFL